MQTRAASPAVARSGRTARQRTAASPARTGRACRARGGQVRPGLRWYPEPRSSYPAPEGRDQKSESGTARVLLLIFRLSDLEDRRVSRLDLIGLGLDLGGVLAHELDLGQWLAAGMRLGLGVGRVLPRRVDQE